MKKLYSMFVLVSCFLYTNAVYSYSEYSSSGIYASNSKVIALKSSLDISDNLPTSNVKVADIRFITNEGDGLNVDKQYKPKTTCDRELYPYSSSSTAVYNCASVAVCQEGILKRVGCTSCKEGYTLNGRKCDPTVCETTQYPLSTPIDNCESSSTCLSGKTVYYGCTSCKEGYSLENGVCKEIECPVDEYPSTTSSITGCSKVITCKSAKQNRYKCSSCHHGYSLSGGLCSANTCSATDYPYSSPVEYCLDTTSCQAGADTKYGCTDCKSGYHKVYPTTGGFECMMTLCLPSDYPYDSEMDVTGCDIIDYCQTGETTKYGCSKCHDGYHLEDGKCKEIDCSYYPFTSSTIPGCKSVETCQSPTETKYRCNNCKSGYILVNNKCQPQLGDESVSFTVTVEAGTKFGITVTGAGIVSWGDESFNELDETGANAYMGKPSIEHTYNTAGSYDVHIWGDALTHVRVYKNYTGYITKLIKVNLPSVTDYDYLFREAYNMVGKMEDVVLHEGLTSAEMMFYKCSRLTGDIPHLPNSLTNADGMFTDCSQLAGKIQNLPSNLYHAYGMFEGCSKLTGSIPAMPEQLYSANKMFDGCSKLTGGIPKLPDTLSYAEEMFSGCRGLNGKITNIPANLSNGYMMFYGCHGLTGSIPTLPSKLSEAFAMFDGCWSLTGNIPTLPSKLSKANIMFAECAGLTGTIPTLPNSLTKAEGMFAECKGLTGTCPTRPTALSSYSGMYRDTGVSCTYGK